MPDRLRVASDGTEVIVAIEGTGVRFADTNVSVAVTASGDGRYSVTDRVDSWSGVAAESGDTVWVGVEGEVFAFRVGTSPARSRSLDQEALMSPMPATVVRVAVAPGQAVRQGDLLIALEAMKMELPIHAPRDGVVRGVHCREGDRVQPGVALVTM